MTTAIYAINLCLRRRGQNEYDHLGICNLASPPPMKGQARVMLPDGQQVSVWIDRAHLIPVHNHAHEGAPIIYATEMPP